MFKIQIQNLDLKQTAESGQCFRMTMQDETCCTLIAKGRILHIKDIGNDEFELSCDEKEYHDLWYDYLDLGSDYSKYLNAVDPDDGFLTAAVSYGSGIRILRQEPFETLISFIISQRKSIPAIRSSIDKICRLCGDKISDEGYAFPAPNAIASLSEKELSDCSLGYRTPYVKEAAKRIDAGDVDLEAFRLLSDEALYEELVSFKGVGKKVANCVMLFAYHRIASFPVDVWIKRIEDKYYDGRFPVEKYPGFAGVLQQYMFFFARFSR